MEPVWRYTGHHPAKTFPAADAGAPLWLWLCHLAKESIGCHLGLCEGLTLGGHLCLLRCALCCGGGVPIPGHAVLSLPWKC